MDAVTEILPPDHLPALIKEEPVHQHIVEVQHKKPKERKVWYIFLGLLMIYIYL